ncbi:flavin reductase family protein [Arcticibacter tournemirensis]|uniref:Flavin reductase family protein n=1 Tax=Arcticibacter tournemirensis TaxID=699437 RepID=A0A4Q0MAN7_9SPHI|nr:flavin reductase family protein [Arcticibacter tournemirensis]RXF70063.1 flavin reductase family protein [Arcticibacter tournemirensis]
MEEFAVNKVFRLLEPGPVVLVTTSFQGNMNVMTMGFHMMVQHEPPLIGAIIGPWDHSYTALKETGECVIAIPTAALAEKVVDIGNCSGRHTDKFATFGLTSSPAGEVEAPLIKECYANIECKVVDKTLANKYDLFILEAVKAWVDPKLEGQPTMHHKGDGTFSLDGKVINLQDRMVKWKQFQD